MESNMEMGTIFWDTQNGNENYILGHSKWKWELYFGTEGVVHIDIKDSWVQ